MNIPIAVFTLLILAGHDLKKTWKETVETLRNAVILELRKTRKEESKPAEELKNSDEERSVGNLTDSEDQSNSDDEKITDDEFNEAIGNPKGSSVTHLNCSKYLPENQPKKNENK
jgi:hypothetical protein